MKKVVSVMSNLQTNCRLKLGFNKWTNIQKASGWLTAPNTAKTISSQVDHQW